MSGMTIPYEVADSIAVVVMKDHLEYLRKDVKDHLENGAYMHPDDYVLNTTKYIPALETLIVYFGGEVV